MTSDEVSVRKGLLRGHLSGLPQDPLRKGRDRALEAQQPSVDLRHAEAGPTGITGPAELVME